MILLIIVGAVFWHFYGDTFDRAGVLGVFDEVSSDLNGIKENPKIARAVDSITTELDLLFDTLTENIEDQEQTNQSGPEKPELEHPSEQLFSIHNIELGDMRSDVEEQVGLPKRSTMNEYGTNWYAYHENYHNFFMVAYNTDDEVVGLYTNQALVTSLEGINFDSTRESVLSKLGEPLKAIRKGFVNYQIANDQVLDMFLIHDYYVTIFYDKHENSTVTAVQIISEELENQKDGYYAEPNTALKEGFEYQLFDLTNAARVNHDLPVLSWDESVRMTARDHSKDMAINNYFSHTNLEGQSPFDRMTEDNISYRMAGENLAAGLSSSIFAHEGLMNSIGHRESILQPGFESLAVGVAFDAESKPFYTENFLAK